MSLVRRFQLAQLKCSTWRLTGFLSVAISGIQCTWAGGPVLLFFIPALLHIARGGSYLVTVQGLVPGHWEIIDVGRAGKGDVLNATRRLSFAPPRPTPPRPPQSMTFRGSAHALLGTGSKLPVARLHLSGAALVTIPRRELSPNHPNALCKIISLSFLGGREGEGGSRLNF